MDDLLKEYLKKFGEPFPTMVYPDKGEAMKNEIKKCIAENKPYKPEYKEDVYY